MDLNETKDLIKRLYPTAEIKHEFDKECLCQIEIRFTKGEVHPSADAVYNKAKIKVQSAPGLTVDTDVYRESISIKQVLQYLNDSKTHINDSDFERLRQASVLKNLNRPNNGFDELLKYMSQSTGYSEQEILSKAGL